MSPTPATREEPVRAADAALATVVFVALSVAFAPPLAAQTGNVPLVELETTYQDLGEPGLYPSGENRPTGDHLELGRERTRAIEPRAADGTPAADGWIGFLALGMSNVTQEWSTFEREVVARKRVSPRVVLAGGAQGGWGIGEIRNPQAPYWDLVDDRVFAAGLTAAQVQVVWLKEAIEGPLGLWPDEALELRDGLRDVVDILEDRFPNLRVVYLSSRIYGGYGDQNPEPYAYETAWGVKWLIEEQVQDLASGGGLADGPWLAWGPYMWADGPVARVDGLTWLRSHFEFDGTHPSSEGELQVAQQLGRFLLTNPLASSWFTLPAPELELDSREPSADAHVAIGAPGSNFGDLDFLSLRGGREAHLRFDLTGLGEPVERAELSLVVTQNETVRGGEVFRAAHTDWQEDTITWDDAPPASGPPLRRIPRATRETALSLDVTSAVEAALAEGEAEIGFVLVGSEGARSGASDSRESERPPRLVVTLGGI